MEKNNVNTQLKLRLVTLESFKKQLRASTAVPGGGLDISKKVGDIEENINIFLTKSRELEAPTLKFIARLIQKLLTAKNVAELETIIRFIDSDKTSNAKYKDTSITLQKRKFLNQYLTNSVLSLKGLKRNLVSVKTTETEFLIKKIDGVTSLVNIFKETPLKDFQEKKESIIKKVITQITTML